MIELTIYTHTLRAKYCKHFFLYLTFFYFCFIILCSSFETLCGGFKCGSAKEQNEHPFKTEGEIP